MYKTTARDIRGTRRELEVRASRDQRKEERKKGDYSITQTRSKFVHMPGLSAMAQATIVTRRKSETLILK